MASQRIKLAPGLTVAVYPIGTMPMEAGSGVMMVVVFIVVENKEEIGMESPHFCLIIAGGCVVAGGATRHESRDDSSAALVAYISTCNDATTCDDEAKMR